MNARAPLLIPWCQGCWEHVHPDVLYLPEGFMGYHYWMAFTPCPRGNDRFENPTLRASHEGLAWVKLSGIPEPVVPTPNDPETHNGDPDIVFHHGRLYMIYATINDEKRRSTFNFVSSAEGQHWSEPHTIYSGTLGVSPACVADEDAWYVWFIRQERNSSSSELLVRKGPALVRLGKELLCQLDIPGHIPWHIDVQKVDSGLDALVAAYPEKEDHSRTSLFHAFSKDGLYFILDPANAILRPSSFGWDNRMIYRSSFLKQADGTYRIWYSAASWGRRFGIGHLQGPLDDLMEDPAAPFAPVPAFAGRLWGELNGGLRYQARHHLPAFLLRRMVRKP